MAIIVSCCVVVMLYCWWCFFATKLCQCCVSHCVQGLGGLWWFVRVRLRCGAGVWCDHGQCTVQGVPTTTTTTTSLHCVTPHHNPRYSVPSVAPAQPLVSIFCRSSAPVSRIMIPPDLSPKVFSSCHNPPANQSFPAGPLMIHSTSETTSIILLYI